MSLEKEYERPYQRNEPESLQFFNMKYVRYNNILLYPEKKVHSILEKLVKKFVPYSGECEYRLDYRCKNKDQPWGVATIYHPPLFKNHKKIKELEKDENNFRKTDKLTLITYNSIEIFKPIFYRNHMPKPMIMKKILQMIEKNLDKFKHWGCDFNCVKQLCNCENDTPVFRYVCYKLYS